METKNTFLKLDQMHKLDEEKKMTKSPINPKWDEQNASRKLWTGQKILNRKHYKTPSETSIKKNLKKSETLNRKRRM